MSGTPAIPGAWRSEVRATWAVPGRGNLGGPVFSDIEFRALMVVDYVRLTERGA